MPVLRPQMAAIRPHRDAERRRRDLDGLTLLAQRQHGAVSRGQLARLGVAGSALTRWLANGRLHRVHPRVYALGHPALSVRGRLIAALLYGGDQAVLSHTTAAWAWSLIEAEPRRIHLTVPGRRPSLPEVRVHHSRRVDRTEHACPVDRAEARGLAVTSPARTIVDVAAMLTPRQLRRALAEADYRALLDPLELEDALGRGRAGSRAARAALRSHLPALAQTLSELEERFLELIESSGVPLPEVNARVGRIRVDALWRGHHLAAELDGGPAHGGAAAMRRDRERELFLRSRGFRVVRYSWEQVVSRPGALLADLRRLLDTDRPTADRRRPRSRGRAAPGP